MIGPKRCFEDWQKLTEGLDSPALIVDLVRFDANVEALKKIAFQNKRRLRLTTKSLRVPELIKRALRLGEGAFQGLMCYSVPEAAYLFEQGLDDFLVAYPTLERSHMQMALGILKAGGKIALTVDHPEQWEMMLAHWRNLNPGCRLPVCLDVDVSFRPGNLLHMGVRRSSILTLGDFEMRLRALKLVPEIELVGVMAYEAHIAGFPYRNPFTPLVNWAKEAIRKIFIEDTAQKRAKMSELIKKHDLNLRFFNGGGTGSLSSTIKEPWITEIAVGSGLFHAHLFDYYRNHPTEAALFFSLPVTRRPAPGFITCQSGGLMASGPAGADRGPIPHSPVGLTPTASEGYGEVQTPFSVPEGVALMLGDRVILRPAKSGEITERFGCVHLLGANSIEGEVPTYRGLQKCFY